MLDYEVPRHATGIVGSPILPLVKRVSELCQEAARYLLWGVAKHDIMDTATMLHSAAPLDSTHVQQVEGDIPSETYAMPRISSVVRGRNIKSRLPVTAKQRRTAATETPCRC
jgi:3-carboxy-cis,cis-muconate cycloisomerase